MVPIVWLPPRPLTIEEAREYERRHEEIEACVPLLGERPDPDDAVLCCAVRVRDLSLYTAYDPEAATWVAIERGLASDLAPRTDRILEAARAFVDRHYPDASIAPIQPPPLVG